MKIFRYDLRTYEFLKITQARLDPLETKKQGLNVFLIPAGATTKSPPIVGMNKVARFNKQLDKWEVVPDFRGTVYWMPNGDKFTITKLGVLIPNGAVTKQPPEKVLTQDELIENEINNQIRLLAIKQMKADGKLDASYKEPVVKNIIENKKE